jgi:recombination protein U
MSNDLELRVRKTNIYYKLHTLAMIQKIETPLLFTNDGIQPAMSTIDFIGCYGPNGRGIAFDAKECESKTSFPLKNIKQHQFLFLSIFEQVGGHAFFLMHFKKLYQDQAFMTPISVVAAYFADTAGRKSIPVKEFSLDWLVDISDYLKLKG